MSQFDASTFLDATTTEESVKRPPLPIGDYTAVIGELKAGNWVAKDDPTKAGAKFDVPLTIDVPGTVQEELGLNSPTLTIGDSMMLDVTPQGALDYSPGKNAKLRKYRDATGQNQKGVPFNPRMLQGKVVTVKIGHREYQGDLFEQVQGVAPVGG